MKPQLRHVGQIGSPVVVIDDSLSSGTSLRKAIQTLEEEGFDVEGAVAMVTSHLHYARRQLMGAEGSV